MTDLEGANACHASGTIWFKAVPDGSGSGWLVVPVNLDENNQPMVDAPNLPKRWPVHAYPTEQGAHEKARQIALHWRKMHP